VTSIVFLILLDLILGWIFFLIFEKPFQMIKLKLNTKEVESLLKKSAYLEQRFGQ
jgi:hypothetical protein